ncbi:TonB-dependent receptor plug domain-containing protein [Zoogloea sp.]|uniref:TonB-dependent receptor plug domain-containing protein n=1 Tax=Zoogloea sp. TaxID=49181 RepID=UPI0035AE10C2
MPPYRACLALPVLLCALLARADDAPLVDMALEELAGLDVATVSRKAQKLSETPAAVTVLTAEDIRRSGARSVPEALREVPGLNVAQIGGGRWSVGVRGAEGRFANKLLVQIDGRSVYSPLFSGVFWEALDVMLEDVERIEVIRGPGASLWGANAVNGVINIVTRKAAATRGGLLSVRVDDRGHPAVAVRQGVEFEGIGALRVFAKGSELTPSRPADGRADVDANRGWLAGFRADGAGSKVNAWTLQGNAYRRTNAENLATNGLGGITGLLPLDFVFQGTNLLGRYSWGLLGGEASLQGYVDQQQAEVAGYGHGSITSADVDFQHRLVPVGAHELMWGVGHRYVQTEITTTTPVLTVSPQARSFQIVSAFVQDEITLQPRTWKLTLGSRFEHSTLSHYEPQPTARLMWTPSDADSLWANWSRAARTPSIGEIGASILYGVKQTGVPYIPQIFIISQPGPDWRPRAERVDALELGYRRNLGNGSFEAVLFRHDYRRLVGDYLDPVGLQVPGVPYFGSGPYVPLQNIYRGNVGTAHSTGIELGLDLPVTATLRMQASYTLMNTRVGERADIATQASNELLVRASPHYWASLHGLVNLGRGRELDLMLRRVGAVGLGDVPAYTAVDLRYGWRASAAFELAVVGANLFDRRHMEYTSSFFPTQPAYIARQGYVQGIWRF